MTRGLLAYLACLGMVFVIIATHPGRLVGLALVGLLAGLVPAIIGKE